MTSKRRRKPATQQPSAGNEHLYGRDFYPASPLSWLAPLWAFFCGVVASGGWTWSGTQALRWLWGLLLVGPLLGTAWGAADRMAWLHLWSATKRGPRSQETVALPYSLAGSPGGRMAERLADARARWQQAGAALQRQASHLAVSMLFSLSVAIPLGASAVLLTLLGLLAALASGFILPQRHDRSRAVFLPSVLSWLLGHAIFARLSLLSAVGAACCTLPLCADFLLVREPATAKVVPGQGLWWHVGSQLVAAALLVWATQPIAAAAVALLAIAPLLLVPLRQDSTGKQRGFSSIQWAVLAGAVITSSALGYRP